MHTVIKGIVSEMLSLITLQREQIYIYIFFHIDLFRYHVIFSTQESTAFPKPLLRKLYVVMEQHSVALEQKCPVCSEKNYIMCRKLI